MTSFPAQRFGLFNRGLLKRDMWADIVIFDQNTIIDKGTFNDPKQLLIGIEYVIVNSEIVIEQGKHKELLPGKILRLNQSSLYQ